jgi:hypothetical protein
MRIDVFHLAKSIAKVACAALAGVSLWASVQASAASFAGPSVVRFAEEAVFTGSDYAPGSAVTIVVTFPGGAEIRDSASVGDDGTLTYRFTPQAAGAHVVTVLDGAGQTLATVNFLGME